MIVPRLPQSHLELVSHNFQTIFAFAHAEHENPVELIPSIFGHELHCSTMGKGRLLKVIYSIIALFAGQNYKQARFLAAIAATKRSFEEIDHFRHAFHDDIFEDYLHYTFCGTPGHYSEGDVAAAREEIKKFYLATYPLLKLVKKQSNSKLNQFLTNYFQDQNKNKPTPFLNFRSFKTIKDYAKIMAMEGLIGGELPLNLFQKISISENADHIDYFPVDKTTIDKFVKKVQQAKKEGSFQIEVLHRGLKGVIRHLKDHDECKRDLKHLEMTLIHEGCIFLEEFDVKHLAWRKAIKEGDALIKPGESFYYLDKDDKEIPFIVGKQLKGIKKVEDLHLVYEIIDTETSKVCEDKLMLIAPNKWTLEYDDFIKGESDSQTPETLYIHPTGKYAIVERLPYAVGNIQWKSELLGNLSDEDRKFVEPLKGLIQLFIDKGKTPQTFKMDYLHFDDQYRLKTIKEFIESDGLDYMALEEMAFNLAHGENLPVYQELTEPLRNDEWCTKTLTPFFIECIQMAFKSHPLKVEAVARGKSIENSAIIERAQKLYSYAVKMKETCIDHIVKKYDHVNQKKLRAQLSENLIRLYTDDLTLGRFWDSVKVDELLFEVEEDLDKFCTNL